MAAHEMKRLGMAHKPMIIGLKANVAEIAATYQTAYPYMWGGWYLVKR